MDGERAPFAPNSLGAIPGEVTVTLGEAAFNRSVVKAGHTNRRFVLDLQDAFTDAVCEQFDVALTGSALVYKVLWGSGVDDPAARVELNHQPETAEHLLTWIASQAERERLSQELVGLVKVTFDIADWVEQTPQYAGMAIAVTLDEGDAA